MKRVIIVAVSAVTVVGALMLALNAQAVEKGITEQHKAHLSSSGCCGGGARSESQTGSAKTSAPQHYMMAQQYAGTVEKAAVPKQMMQHGRIMMQSRMFLDEPGAIYGQAEILGLSEQQKKQLIDIQNEARRKALSVLTTEQREKIGDIPDKPLTMAVMCQQMCEKMMPMMQEMMSDERTAGSMMMCPMMQGMSQSTDTQTQTPQQTTCPVMGGAIDKSIFIEYKGEKVYFCCPACKPKFEAEPEKYLAKLPTSPANRGEPQFQNLETEHHH